MISEIATYLDSLEILDKGTDLFISRQSDSPDNQVVIYNTGGLEPDRYLPTADPTFQIIVRNVNYQNGQNKVNEIVEALHQLVNIQLEKDGTYFFFIMLMSEPAHIGRDDKGRHEFSINFVCKIRR